VDAQVEVCIVFTASFLRGSRMKSMALLLVAAALSASGALGAALTSQAVPRHLPSTVEMPPLPSVPPEIRWDVAANFDDGPIPVPPRVRPYDAVGLIADASRTRTGTGFLIGPCTVLTAYHVLFPPGVKPSKRTEFVFALGHGGNMVFELVMPAKPVLWGDFSYLENTPTEDFAVLNVPSCPGRKFSPIPLVSMSVAEIEQAGGELRNAGYPIGRSMGRVWGDEDCAVGGAHPLEPDLFAVNCSATPGMSGGPVLAEIDGQLLAVAIMSRVVSETGKRGAFSTLTGEAARDVARFNMALPVSAFLARLNIVGLVGP
jgi:V8-like Glu-specific endopeptidase